MRFVLSLGLMSLLSTAAFAAPWDVVPLADNTTRTAIASRPVQMQRSSSSNTLQTIKGLDLKVAAIGLSKISAMALSEDGTIYAADAQNGRLWALTDRGRDGKIDLRRPLPFSFSNPTGLAVIGSTLFVADRNAVWIVERGQEPKILASLKNTYSTGGPHNLSVSQSGEALTLSLTTKNWDFRILSLDIHTGVASLIGEGTSGQLHSLAQRKGSKIWAASGSTLGTLGTDILEFMPGQSIRAITLPGQYETPANWPGQLTDHIIAAQVGPNAMHLLAIPTEFGHISGSPRVLVDGFLLRSGRSAWGQPGPMVMDKRGLFFADSYNGVMWRLSPTPPVEPKVAPNESASLPATPSTEPKLSNAETFTGIKSTIKGTQIDAKSTIVQPSSIAYGSKIIKDYDDKKALEDADKAEETPK